MSPTRNFPNTLKTKSGFQPKDLPLSRVKEVWEKVLDDPDAKLALKRLEQDGFPIAHLTTADPVCQVESWADYIAALPFLPNQPSKTRVHRHRSLRRHRILVHAIRDLAEKVDNPFVEKRVITDAALPSNLGKHLRELADSLERFLSWDWYTREINPRNSRIAMLRWTIRSRTGKPHDRELSGLIDAAFRAAEVQELYLDATTLERIERLAKEGRVKATCRLQGLCPDLKLINSTSFPRNRQKRV